METIKKIDLYRYISFSEKLLKREAVLKSNILPELAVFENIVRRKAFQDLAKLMDDHNATVRRGGKMHLIKHFDVSRLLFTSVSAFLINMHSDKVAQALLAICAFGERIAPRIATNPDALFWKICEGLMITSDRWRRLSQRMMRLSNLLRTAFDSARLDGWPGLDALERTASRIAAVFGGSPLPTPEQVAELAEHRRISTVVTFSHFFSIF